MGLIHTDKVNNMKKRIDFKRSSSNVWYGIRGKYLSKFMTIKILTILKETVDTNVIEVRAPDWFRDSGFLVTLKIKPFIRRSYSRLFLIPYLYTYGGISLTRHRPLQPSQVHTRNSYTQEFDDKRLQQILSRKEISLQCLRSPFF